MASRLIAGYGNNTEKVSRWKSFGIWAVSPLYLSLTSTTLGFISLIFPPHWLTTALQERDVVFMNAPMALVMAISELAFILGLAFYAQVHNHGKLVARRSPNLTPTRMLCKYGILLSAGSIIVEALIAIIMILRVGLTKILIAFTSPNAGIIFRQSLVGEMRIHGINILAFQAAAYPALLVSTFIAMSVRGNRARRVSLAFAIIGGFSYIIINLLTFTRWQVLQYFLSVGLLLVICRNGENGISKTRLLHASIIFLGISSALFVTVNALKTHISGPSAILGYTIGSYNVGAAVASGDVAQPYANSSYGALGFFWNAPMIGPYLRDLGRADGLDLPSGNAGATNVWSSWSNALDTAGLNPTYQWDTVFSYIYGDTGLIFPVIFFLYGYISQSIFSGFMMVRPIRFLLYFPFMTSIVTWFTSVFISNTTLDDFFIFSLLIVSIIKHQWLTSIENR